MTSEPTPEHTCVIDGCESLRWTSGLLCAIHKGRLLRALREIPQHATTITRLLGHTTTPAGDHVSGSKERPLPAASVLVLTGPEAEVSSYADPMGVGSPTVLAVVGSWAQDVEDSLHLSAQIYPSSLIGLRMVCETITRNYDDVCALPQVDEMFGEIDSVWHHVRTAAGDAPQPQRGKVPCPVETCHMRALISEEPGEPYRCAKALGGCGNTISEAQHDALADALGSRFLTHDEQVHLDAQQEQVAEALHWRDDSPRHIPKPDPGEPSTVRAYGTANDAMEGAA